jgi:transcriptional regulator with XRE-family HTH domain
MRLRHRPLTVPMRAHPVVQRLYVEMNAQQCTAADVSERSGVNKNTLKDWRTRTAPTIDNLEACLNVLGLELAVRERTRGS